MAQYIDTSKYARPVLQISDLEGVTGIGNQKDEWTHRRLMKNSKNGINKTHL